MRQLFERIQLFTRKHRKITAAVLGLLVVVLFSTAIFGSLRTQAAAQSQNPIHGIADDSSLVELSGTKETVAESFAGASDRAQENQDQDSQSQESNQDNKDQNQSKSPQNSGNTSRDGQGNREGDQGNNKENDGGNDGGKSNKDKNLDNKNDKKEEYFRTTIENGAELTVVQYEYSIKQLTDLKVKSVEDKVNEDGYSSYDGKLNLDGGENKVTVKVTYIGEDGKSFDVKKSYTLYVNFDDIVIRSSRLEAEEKKGKTEKETLNFDAEATYLGEKLDLQVKQQSGGSSQEIQANADGSYTATLKEGENVFKLHAEKGGISGDKTYTIVYQIPSEKQFKVSTSLEAQDGTTVKRSAFSFDAIGLRGGRQVDIMVSFNGTSIDPSSPNNYDVVLEEGQNTFTLIPYEGMDEGEAYTYTVTFTKKTAEEGGSDSNQDLPTIQSSLDDITDGKVTNSPLSFMVYATDYQGNGIAPSQVTAQCNGVEYSQLWGDSGQVSYSVDLLENSWNTIVVSATDKDGNNLEKAYSIFYEPAQAEVAGTVTLSVEATTVGIGNLIGPMQVEFTQGQRLSELLVQVLEENGFTAEYTGNLDSEFYLSHITADGWNFMDAWQVPEDLEAHLYEINEMSAKPVYPYSYYPNSLGEFDLCSGSGWMYCVNGAYPNFSMANCTLQDGDEIRIRFTLYYGADIGGGGALGNGGNMGESTGNWEREW